jgi:hypothetical protein
MPSASHATHKSRPPTFVTGTELSPGGRTVPCESPDGSWASVNVDLKGGRPVGIEILGANERLHPERLAEAE